MPITNGVPTVLEAPLGYVVDFNNPQRVAVNETYWVVAMGNFLALFFIAQLLYCKVVLNKRFQLEDACIVGAWLTSIGTQAVLTRMFAAGVVGVHAWEISVSQYSVYSLLILIAPVVYAPCSGLAKMTLLLFYHKISPQTWFVWTVRATMFIVVGYTIGILFSLIFGCNPIAKSWDISITEGSCISQPALYISTAVLGIVTDLILLVLPIPMLIGLRMPVIQKVGLMLMFTIGSATLITSVVRLVILLPVLTNMDQPWAIAYPCTWICVEANLLVICSSLPTLRQFFRHVAPKLIGERNSGNSGSDDPPSKGSGFGIAPSNLRTFGSSGNTRRKYNKFGESDYDMTVLEPSQGGDDEKSSDDSRPHGHRHDRQPSRTGMTLRPEIGLQTEHQVSKGDGRVWDARPTGDGESEKAIMQTRTVTVSYENSMASSR